MNTETTGRRTYIVDATYQHRDALRAAGAHWDADRRQWWLGDRKKAEALAAKLAAADGNGSDRKPHDGERSLVCGRAKYKGREYYIAANRHGDPVATRDGRKLLLYFRDGSAQFWAAVAALSETRRFRCPRTIAALHRYGEQVREQRRAAAEAMAKAAELARRSPEEIEAERKARAAQIAEIARAAGVTVMDGDEASFERHAEGGVSLGDVIKRSDGSHWLVVYVGTPYYRSPADCEAAEEQDYFGLRPGWITPYRAVQCSAPEAERRRAEEAAAEIGGACLGVQGRGGTPPAPDAPAPQPQPAPERAPARAPERTPEHVIGG